MADDVDYDKLASSLFPQPQGKPDGSGTGGGPGATDYDRVLSDMLTGQVGANLRAVQGTNADQAARAQALSRASGLPLPAVEGEEDRVEADLRRQSAEAALRDAPRVSTFFSEPTFAKVAHDDAENLGFLERTWSKISQTVADEAEGAVRGFRRGMLTTDLRDVGRKLFWGKGTPEDEARVQELQKLQELNETDAFLGAAGEQLPIMGSIAGQALKRGLQTGMAFGGGVALLGQLGPQAALPEELVTVPAATMTGLAIGGRAGGLEAAWELETYLAYLEYRDLKTADGRPMDVDVARGAAMLAGTINAGLEAYGFSAIAKRLPGVADLAKLGGRKQVAAAIGEAARSNPTLAATLATFGKRYVEGIAIESLTEMVQELSTASFAEIAKMWDGGAFKAAGLDEITERVIDAGVQAAKATAVLGMPGPAMQAVGERRQAAKARRDAEAMREAGDVIDVSLLAQRDPERFGEVQGAILRDQGVDTIAIPAARLQELFQSEPGEGAPIDQATLMRNLGVTDEQMAEALAVGGDVHMTPEAFAQHVLADKATRAALVEHVRLGVDGMTEAEAKEWETTGLRDAIDDMASLLDSMDSGRRVEAARIEAEVESMMVAAGEARDTARYAAVLTAQRYSVRAERAGVSPLQLWQEDNLRVERLQDMGRVVDDIDIILDKARSPDTLKLPKTPILDMLARTGVDPNSPLAGELKAMGITAKSRPGLFKVGGRQAADNLPLAEMPWFTADDEDGTGNYVSEAAVLAAVRDELAGNPRRTADEQAQLDGRENDIRNLEADLERYNEMSGNALSVATSSAAEIRDALQELADLDARASLQQEGQTPAQNALGERQDEQTTAAGQSEGTQASAAPAAAQAELKALEAAAALDGEASTISRSQSWATGRELKMAMQTRVLAEAAAAGIDLSADTPQVRAFLVRMAVRDALAALKTNANAVGWYDVKTRQALAVMALVHPEIATDENARFAFTWALAVTSNGQRVDANFELAQVVYSRMKASNDGHMPTDIQAGNAQAAINKSLALFNQLKDSWGIDNLRRFMLTDFTVGEITAIDKEIKPSGEWEDQVVRGAAIIGPKIGNGFFSNLYGYFDALTMDRWLVRTWGRWTGTLIEIDKAGVARQRARLREALSNLDVASFAADMRAVKRQGKKGQTLDVKPTDRERLIAALEAWPTAAAAAAAAAEAESNAPGSSTGDVPPDIVALDAIAAAVNRASMTPAFRDVMDKTEPGGELRLAGNGLAKFLDGQKEQPAGPGERVLIRDIFSQALEQLRVYGADADTGAPGPYAGLTMSDLQAVLWYAEKRLYETAKEDAPAQADMESRAQGKASGGVQAVAQTDIEGYEDDEAPDYANAAAKVARAAGVSERRISAALKKAEDGRAAAARPGNAQAGQGVAGQPQAARGFAGREKRKFIEVRAVHRARSNRSGDAQSPWAYQGKSRRDGEGVRLLVRKTKLGVTTVAEWTPGKAIANAFRNNGMQAPTFYELAPGDARNAERFAQAISASKAQTRFGPAVYVYPPEDYAGMRLFMSDDGKSGVAVKPDGDIVSVFGGGGTGRAIMELAVAAGGRKLDAFDTILPEFYAAHGFRAVSRLKWDDSQAPAGWDKATFGEFNNGEPDVVFMVYDPEYRGEYSPRDGKVYKGARAYDMAVSAQARETRPAPATLEQSAPSLPATIEVDGVARPTTNSEGRPIAQTEDGVRAFWRWFGDSKVVDAEGRPLVVYHGSPVAGFTEFDPSKINANDPDGPYNGFWFSSSQSDADVSGRYPWGRPNAANPETRDYYLALQNPATRKQARSVAREISSDWEAQYPAARSLQDATRLALRARGFDGVVHEPFVTPDRETFERDGVVSLGKRDAELEREPDGSVTLLERGEEVTGYSTFDEAVFSLRDGVFVAFDPTQIKSATGNRGTFDPASASILEQRGAARGSIQFNAGATIIRLGANADRSTFLHESGHLYLEQLRADAARFGANNQQLADDLKTVNEWFASDAAAVRAEAIEYARKAGDDASVTALQAMTDAQVAAFARAGAGMPRDASPAGHLSRALHERWARGVEDYFRTGQAPSVALQDAFNRFRAWLVSIYAALRRRLGAEQLEVSFSPEVKAVMDRMLATDEEIALVEQQYNLRAMFATPEEANMSPERFAAYQKAVMAAGEAARTEQLRRHLREVERERASWWRAERAKLREEVAAEVRARPVFLAIHALAAGKMPDGQPIPGGLVQPRMDRAAVVALLENEKSLSRLPRVKGRTVYATAKGESGSHPDVVASFYGFDGGREMLIEMMNTDGVEKTIDRETDARMRERHGDMQVDGTAVEKAVESAHTDKRGDVLVAEINALQNGGGPAGGGRVRTAFLRQWARERIAGRKISELQPQRFLMAERKAGRDADRAMAAGDRAAALKAKFQQALNFHMAREAYKARVEIDKAVEYLSGFQRAGAKFPALEAGYVDQIRTILEAYQFGPPLSDRTRVKLEMQAVLDWIERQRRDAGAVIEVPQRILDADERTNYRTLSLDEFRTLRDTIKNLEAQGRLAKTALIDGEEMAISDMADQVVARVEQTPQLARMARRGVEQNPGVLDRARSKLASFDAALRKVEILIEQVDGQRMGPLWRFLFKPFSDAETARKDMTLRVTKRVMDALDTLPTRSRLAERINVPMLGRTFARSDLIMMALNVGNESNLAKMIEGSEKDITEGARPFTLEGVDSALANLTAEEWVFVQEVWDAFEAMWPQVQAVYRRENGVAPERVDAREIQTRYGQTLRGGYFPMMYDPARSVQARDIEGKSALEAMQSTVVRASVNSSMTKARTGFSAPVLLDITALPNHIERTAHFITHYEPVRIARKLLARRDVARAINNRVGPEYYDTLKAWVQELAANGQPVAPTSIGGRIVEAMRRNATVAIMGLSYTTMVAQVFGLANSIDALSRQPGGGYSPRRGTTAMLGGLVRYLSAPATVRRQVFAASGEMRHRLQNTDRDIRHALQQLSGKKGAWSQMQRFSMLGIAGIQLYMVDLPTWLAAYDQAIARGATTDEAVDAADNLLRTSQTAGGIKDLAAIQRERGVMTALTMFYSYFNLLYNLQRQALGNVGSARDVPQLAARAFILMAIPVLVDALVKRQGPDEDKDETAAGWFALKAVVYALSSLPFLRDLVGMAEGFGYKPTPLDGFGKALGATVKGIAQAIDNGELDAKALKAMVSALGFGAGVPATQVNRVISAADAMFEGEDVGVYDFLAGPKKDK